MAIALGGKRGLAIDWDAHAMRVVQYRARGATIDILKALSVPIPAEIRLDDAESLGAFLRQAVEQARIGERRAAIDIPRDKVVLNTLTLPPTPLDDLPALVHFQIVKELPFAADQATIDFAVRGEIDPKSPVHVLVAAVRNEVMNFYRQLAREAGLRLERVGLRPHANLVAVTAGWEAARRGRLLVVDVGPELTEINVIRDGGLVFSRAASVRVPASAAGGGADELLDSRLVMARVPSPDELDEPSHEAVSDIVVEVTRSIEAYRATDPELRLNQIVIGGATGIELRLAEALSARFDTPTELYNPGRALDLPPQRARELRGFSAAIGLALAHDAAGPDHFNFQSPKKGVTQKARRLRRVPTAAVAGAILVMAVLVHRRYALEPKLERIAELKAEVGSLERELRGHRQGRKHIDGVRDLKHRIDAITAWRESEQNWLAELIALTRVFPDDKQAYATKILFSDQPPLIDVDLRTQRPSVSAAFVSSLNEDGFDAIVGKSAESPAADKFQFTDSVKVALPEKRVAQRNRTPATVPAARKGAVP